jgi:hypothetical protein
VRSAASRSIAETTTSAGTSSPLHGDPLDGVDQGPDAALRVEHAAFEVERAHQVVHAGGLVGRAAEEHGGVLQDPREPAVGEPARDEAVQRQRQHRREPRQAAHHLGHEQRLIKHRRANLKP